MKILHTSDWHIGHMLYAKKRGDEHERFLSWLGDTICERRIDALVVSGDVFDTGAPGGSAQRLYYNFLTSLIGTCCKTVIIVAGNHDSPTLLEAPSGVLERLNIHIIGLPAAPERHVIPLRDGEGMVGALCCAVPYLRKNEMVRIEDDGVSSDEKIVRATSQFYRGVTDAALRSRVEFGEEVPIIATGHLFAAGAVRSEGDGVRELYVGSLGQVGADIFPEELGYVALGHIHGEQCVSGNEHIRYCGAPLHMSFSELDRRKYVLELDTEGMRTQRIAVPVFQAMKAVKGDFEQIMEGLAALADEDVWVEVTYTGEEVRSSLSADIYGAVRGKKAEVLSIRNNAILRGILSSEAGQTLDTLAVQDVFQKCLKGGAYSEAHQKELIECFNEIVSEVGEAPCE